MKPLLKIYITVIALFATANVFAQVEGLGLPTPDINVSLELGFNHDYLKSPLDVDFENAKGYFSVNVPLRFVLGAELIDAIFSEVSDNFTDGEIFMPNIAARQHANTTIRVDVPMLWGVCSFSHMNVMSLNYRNTTGIPSFRFRNADESGDIATDLFLRGNINTPINFSLGWESMMFGYVYQFNEKFRLGLNLHRHRFHFRLNGNIDIDMFGNVQARGEGIDLSVPVDYSFKNPISGGYSLERWTPTFAGRFWNFDFFARIMFDDKARGALSGKYAVPFFIDPSTFQPVDGLEDATFVLDNIKNGNFMNSRADTVNLHTNNSMRWQLPSVLTLKYNIIPEKLVVSYSKFIGQTRLELVDESLGRRPDGTALEYLPDGLDLRLGLDIDHLILFNAKLGWFYGNIGIMSLDVDFRDQTNLLGNSDQSFLINYGRGAMLPILSGGGIIGTKLQFMLELNLLPLTALKTGIVYNF